MHSSIRLFSLSLVIAGLTACGGSGGDSKPKPTSSAAPSSAAPVSSALPTSSAAPASSTAPASSAAPTSSTAPASSAAPASSSLPPSSAVASSSATSSSLSSEQAAAAVSYPAYTIATLENCGLNISQADNTFAVFGDYDPAAQNQSLSALNITSWNHTANGSTTEWVNLKHPAATYNLGAAAHSNSSCNDVDTLDVVLVKKIADWDRQHANGFERNILDEGYTFGAIDNLIVDVKINSAKTSVPSIESLKATYAAYVSAATVEALDEGKVNIDITLHDGANLHAKVIVQLDQETYADQWVRVTIPMEKFSFYEEINYNRTPKTLADLSNVVIKRMLVVGETKKGTVLRGNINPWSASVPETFKEMDLSFKKFEFELQ